MLGRVLAVLYASGTSPAAPIAAVIAAVRTKPVVRLTSEAIIRCLLDRASPPGLSGAGPGGRCRRRPGGGRPTGPGRAVPGGRLGAGGTPGRGCRPEPGGDGGCRPGCGC